MTLPDIRRPYIDDCRDDDPDWSDCDRFLNECISALIFVIAEAADPRDAAGIAASMLEAAAAQLKPKRGRPPGSPNRKRAAPGSASTIARRKREERQRAEEERRQRAETEEFIRSIEEWEAVHRTSMAENGESA